MLKACQVILDRDVVKNYSWEVAKNPQYFSAPLYVWNQEPMSLSSREWWTKRHRYASTEQKATEQRKKNPANITSELDNFIRHSMR